MFKLLIRPFLFLNTPEKAHYSTLSLLRFFLSFPILKRLFRSLYVLEHPDLVTKVFGLTFKNPVGLAAGFDKNAEHIDLLDNCGFGFIEVGTVTPKPQDGNPKPRLFRLKSDEALINRMGFNNEGLEQMIYKLKARKSKLLIGGNIGKNKVTPNEEATKDYLICFEQLNPFVDYFVVNVSSPNTPGLRELQDKEPLTKLLTALVERSKEMPIKRPILLKIAPDLTDAQLDDIIEIVATTNIAGIIATNTTIDRSNLKTPTKKIDEIGAGGLSGRPLKNRSTEVIRYLNTKSNGAFPIIGVGGIHSSKDALEKIEAGASLVQLYTGFVYEGPNLIKDINRKLLKKKKSA
jgi:dihydroorotate dehydrogenase